MKPDRAIESRSLFRPIALLWAGAVIGGSLIAAPAKFQVEELTLSVALEVGRVQFTWLAIAELTLVGLAVFAHVFAGNRRVELRRWPSALFAVAIAIFAVQQLALMPQLHARSLRIIAGESVPESRLHLVYVVVECIKVIVLLSIGFQHDLTKLMWPRELDRDRR